MSYPRRTIYGTLYGALMRFAHRHNWHHTRTSHPDGDTFVRCDWCGLGMVMERRGYKPAITNEPAQEAKRLNMNDARSSK